MYEFPSLHPNEIAKFFELYECPNYARLLFEKKKGGLKHYAKVIEVKSRIDEVLMKWGAEFELRLLEYLYKKFPSAEFFGFFRKNSDSPSLKFFKEKNFHNVFYFEFEKECRTKTLDVLKHLWRLKEPIVIYQPCLAGKIGEFPVTGRADFIVVIPSGEGFKFYVLEAKFTKEEKLFHRFQVIIYAYLLDKIIRELGIPGKIWFSVLTKSEDILKWPPEVMEFPKDAEEYLLTLKSKLSKDGTFFRALKGEQADLWLTRRCTECPFEPICIKEAVEKKDLGILGIPPSYQKVFREAGIESLNDVAELYEFQSKWPTDFRPPTPKNRDAINKIITKTELRSLPKLSKIAQVMKIEIERNAGKKVYPEFIPGTGYNLPAENGYYYPNGSLIRVYIFVQHNPIHDSLLGISAVVENTRTRKSYSFAELVKTLPKTSREAMEQEENLLREFFKKVVYYINKVAPNLEGEYCCIIENGREEIRMPCHKNDGFLHLYFYSRFHRDKLMEAVKRHLSLYGSDAVRSLLSLRGAIDQEGYSLIKDELIRRHALRFPGLGLILSVHQFYLNDHVTYTGNSPTAVRNGWFEWGDIKDKFEELFNFLVEKKSDERLELGGRLYNIARYGFGGWRDVPLLYPVFHREDEQIPLHIFWDTFMKGKRNDLKNLLVYMAMAVRHIERSIPEITKDRYVKKEPLNISALSDFTLASIGLADVLVEYQRLEFHSRKEQLENHYRLPLHVRALTGKSTVIRVNKVEKRNNQCIISGEILLPPVDEKGEWESYNPAEAPLIDLGEDSWVVVTPLIKKEDGSFEIPYDGNPDPAEQIKHSPVATVISFDYETGKIGINLIGGIGRGKFRFWHHYPKNCRNGSVIIKNFIIREGSYLVLDNSLDDINMSRAYEILEALGRGTINHPVYEKLDQIYSTDKISRKDVPKYRTNLWREEDIKYFLRALSQVRKLNEEQENFVKDIDHFLVTLQGPPGTGKTSGAVAPAILARAYSTIRQNKNALFVISGVSHRAINEALKKTSKLLEDMRSLLPELERVELYRGISNGSMVDPIKKSLQDDGFNVDDAKVRFVSPSHTRDLFGAIGVKTLDAWFSKKGSVRILFATPGTLYKMFKDRAERADLVVIDEASMMDMPMFILTTLSASEKGQVLLVGDHRQMQPIQAHEWELEDRKTIEEHVPFLSAINFVRFLRGELSNEELKEFEKLLYRKPPEWEFEDLKEKILPTHRLKKTYRMPEISAKMHRDLFYLADGIKLKSEKQMNKEKIRILKETASYISGWLGWILDPDYPIVLITHDDTGSTKINELEAKLVRKIISAIPKNLEVGIVVPYRAQKARIYKELTNIGRNDIVVDTVERFQGGEKDIIIISMTSSDPSYLLTVFDFIYNPNRFNVAASRMKEKLIVIGAESFFTTSAFDLDQFEKIRPWKKFYIRMAQGEYFEINSDIRAFRTREW